MALLFSMKGLLASALKLYKGPSTLLVLVLVLVLVLARIVLVRGLVWLSLVLVNLRPHYFSCSPG
jgi:hypothetical protein